VQHAWDIMRQGCTCVPDLTLTQISEDQDFLGAARLKMLDLFEIRASGLNIDQ